MLVRALLLLALTVVAYWPQLCVQDWQGTEGRRVQIALEMVRSGDFFVPMLGGEPTLAKPPFHYWLLALLALLGGHDFWIMRLPSVAGLWLCAVFGFALLRRPYGPGAAWVLALGVLLSPVLLAKQATAEIDPLFACLCAGSLWALAVGVGHDRRGLVVAAGLLGGLALLDKGPPYFLFAAGAWLVWWRHRRLQYWRSYFLPLLLATLAYYVPLLLWRVDPQTFAAIANEETIGRVSTFTWSHVLKTPEYWLRAVAVQLPLILWCFWEWRGNRDARMGPQDFPLRACSGAAVLAVVVLTFFPGRPTRYLLPNIPLLVFAVAPAVAHFAAQRRELGRLSRACLSWLGVAGALALIVVPFVPPSLGLSGRTPLLLLAIAVLPFLVRTPRQLVACCFWLPLLAAQTVFAERSARATESGRARHVHGVALQHELQRASADDLQTWGHFHSGLLLGTGHLLRGDETPKAADPPPAARWLLYEAPPPPEPGAEPPPRLPHLHLYTDRLHFCLPGEVYVLAERTAGGR